ncbi:S8 family serine peptidase [Caldilinea sp.]|uniref:S8 family serine peptidase n=1 Tax=Caldilinea sp. TaxID=2293560 RepID=UPI002C4AB705|nr:S8 family serine peptidase [Anaerolineales bacterium]HQY92028.1 S8 family serine peptidase [Caldilinea sp.]
MRITLTIRRLIVATGIVAFLLGAPHELLAQTVEPSTPDQANGQTRLAQALAAELMAAPSDVSFLVILDDQLDPAVAVQATTVQATATAAEDAAARRAAIYTALSAQARQTQAPLRAWLKERGIPYRAHYLVNMLEVRGDLTLAQALAQQPGVNRLVRNPKVAGIEVAATHRPTWQTLAMLPRLAPAATLPWGLTYTNADDVWALGFRGQHIIVAGQDTGVIWEHPALKPAYRGWDSATMTVTHAYNWFDAWGRDPIADSECPGDAQIPCDDDTTFYHGTHTLGTVAGDATVMGDTVIGMAPDATWIACRNMLDGFGTPASYTSCFEFFLAPYPQGGDPLTDGKPELAPHVINNSWGCPPSEGCDAASLRQVVETMRAAGIFVVASAGNGGSGCSTINAPIGMHDAVTSVGAYASNGVIASFSSRGPVTADGSGRLKPDLSAPGVSVRSLGWSGGQPAVNSLLSGTSMASPHVAGAVALLWSLDPQLIGKIDETEQILLNSATPVIDAGCTGVAQSPNPVYGYGRLDMLKAVEMALGDRMAIAVNTAPARSGVVTGGGVITSGATITVTAAPLPGYTFINWAEGENIISIETTYVFTATSNRNLIANFTIASPKLWFPFIAR